MVKTVPHHQVIHRFPLCECGEQKDRKDHRCEDLFHRGSLTENEGNGESEGSEDSL